MKIRVWPGLWPIWIHSICCPKKRGTYPWNQCTIHTKFSTTKFGDVDIMFTLWDHFAMHTNFFKNVCIPKNRGPEKPLCRIWRPIFLATKWHLHVNEWQYRRMSYCFVYGVRHIITWSTPILRRSGSSQI